MKRLVLGVSALLTALLLAVGADPVSAGKMEEGGWVQLFNGKDLTGWKSHPKSPGMWRVVNGVIVSGGTAVSHLFSNRDDYENFHYRVTAKINDKGNSGQYFRATFAQGYPPGYEAQINATHIDTIKTGSLYPAFRGKKMKPLTKEERARIVVTKQLHKPDEWFTQEVIAKGRHIQIFVNGTKTVDFVDEENSFARGHFALQHHSSFKDKASGKEYECVLQVRKIEVKELPRTE